MSASVERARRRAVSAARSWSASWPQIAPGHSTALSRPPVPEAGSRTVSGAPVPSGAGGVRAAGREGGHQGGGAGRGQRVLPGVGVEVTAEQELEGRPDPARLRRELGDPAQEGNGGGQRGGGGREDGPLGAEALGERLLQGDGEHAREPLVRERGERRPGRRPVPYEEEGAARVDEGGDGSGGVARDLLPDALAQRDLGQFALVAEPPLDLGEREGRAGLRAAHGLGEVGVAAAPVADGGPADPCEPGDPGGGHLCRALVRRARVSCALLWHLTHLPDSPASTCTSTSSCDIDLTAARTQHHFTA